MKRPVFSPARDYRKTRIKINAVAGETEFQMKSYVCTVCGYVYDPEENGGIPFEELPEDWVCPMCGVGKDQFEEE